jgi:hypothetical protein
VSTPSHPQPHADPADQSPSSTSEIPVVRPAARQLPPHPGATAMAPPPSLASEGPQPTGPVDFVPGLPGTGTPPPPSTPPSPMTQAPPPPPAATSSAVWPETLESDLLSTPSRERAPRDRRALAGLGLAALAGVVLELGLALDFGAESFWSAVPLWSAFATAAAVVALLAFVASAAPSGRLGGEKAWRVAAAGLLGLSLFWLLVVLPIADTDRGFLLTAAPALLGGALWTGAGRKG